MPFNGITYTPPTGAENAAPGQVVQSAVWDAIFTDISAALTQVMTLAAQGGVQSFVASGVNFNPGAATDTAIPVTLPPGFTRYEIDNIIISGASQSLTTATAGVFTAVGGGGVAVASTQAITVSTAADATNNNSQAMTINNGNTQSYTLAGHGSLFFRVVVSEGAAATANVEVRIRPLP